MKVNIVSRKLKLEKEERPIDEMLTTNIHEVNPISRMLQVEFHVEVVMATNRTWCLDSYSLKWLQLLSIDFS